MGKEITFQTKWDFRNASIGSILTYGLSATKQTHAMESKLQIFASKCLRSIDEKEEEDGVKGTIERNQEEGAGGKGTEKGRKEKKKTRRGKKEKGPGISQRHKTPTIMSYIENGTLRHIQMGNRDVSGIFGQ